MNKSYNSETITAYLLGSLPESEAEFFDELSFTDDAFADDLQSAEKDLVDAYVNDELRGSTLEQFKSFYLASPLRREKVEFARNFQKFAEDKIQNEISQIKEEKIESEVKTNQKSSWLAIFTTPRPSLQIGFAVLTLFLMCLAAWLILENARLRNQSGEIEARRLELQQRENHLQEEITKKNSADLKKEKELADIQGEITRIENELKQKNVAEQQENRRQIAELEIANAKKQTPESRRPILLSFILTPQLRSNNQLQTLKIPTKTDLVATRLELESDDYAFYSVALKNQSDGKILWKSGKLKSKGNKYLSLKFPAKLLRSQNYSLEVSGISLTNEIEIISDYSFKVVR